MSWFRKLLGRNRDTVCPIEFDATGWHPQPRTAPDTWQWKDDAGDTLTVRVAPKAAFGNGDLSDLGRLRSICRDNAKQANSSIVQVDHVRAGSIRGLLEITKARSGRRTDVVGRLTFPLTRRHCVVELDATEHGTTGERDALVSGVLAQRGEIELGPPRPNGEQPILGWFQDPYDSAFDQDTQHALSDDERLDVFFPDHPLSKTRAMLERIQQTATIEEAAAQPSANEPADDGMSRRRGRLSPAVIGTIFFYAHLFPQSEEALTESIAVWTASGRDANADIARQLLFLGLACDGQGKHQEALAVLDRAERAAAAALAPEHPLRYQPLLNQARVHISMNDHAAAEPLFEQALAIFESRNEDTSIAIALNGLGLVRNRQERYGEAIPLFQRALTLFERAHGRHDSQDCGTVWANLAIAFDGVGAARLAQDALARAEAILNAKGAQGASA